MQQSRQLCQDTLSYTLQCKNLHSPIQTTEFRRSNHFHGQKVCPDHHGLSSTKINLIRHLWKHLRTGEEADKKLFWTLPDQTQSSKHACSGKQWVPVSARLCTLRNLTFLPCGQIPPRLATCGSHVVPALWSQRCQTTRPQFVRHWGFPLNQRAAFDDSQSLEHTHLYRSNKTLGLLQ